MPRLIELDSRYRAAGQIVHFVGVSIDDDLDRLDRTIESKGVPWPNLGDGEGGAGEIPRLYHLTGTPTLWLIDGEGNIVIESHSVDEVEKRLEELVG